jgi:hypothetical protein
MPLFVLLLEILCGIMSSLGKFWADKFDYQHTFGNLSILTSSNLREMICNSRIEGKTVETQRRKAKGP